MSTPRKIQPFKTIVQGFLQLTTINQFRNYPRTVIDAPLTHAALLPWDANRLGVDAFLITTLLIFPGNSPGKKLRH
jgi:hypothetical protein